MIRVPLLLRVPILGREGAGWGGGSLSRDWWMEEALDVDVVGELWPSEWEWE